MRYEVTVNGRHEDACCPDKLLTEDEAKIAVMDTILWLQKQWGGVAVQFRHAHKTGKLVFHVSCSEVSLDIVEMVERG